VTLLAYSRPFWPLFLHVLGAMTLWGATLAAVVVALARLPRATLASLGVSVPAWALTLGGAYWIEHDEGLGSSNATWLGIGHGVLEPGLVVLLAAIGCAYWWTRRRTALAARVTASLASLYLVLLTVALLAMSGKWS
jgi:uncharacterized membrane protein